MGTERRDVIQRASRKWVVTEQNTKQWLNSQFRYRLYNNNIQCVLAVVLWRSMGDDSGQSCLLKPRKNTHKASAGSLLMLQHIDGSAHKNKTKCCKKPLAE
jgi:hypothetical protein